MKTETELSATEIKIRLLKRGVSAAELARRWNVPRQNVTRVINRTSGFVFPEIRQKLAEFLDVPVTTIGREASRNARLVRAA